MTYDFGSDIINAGRVGDRALHEVEIAPELEGGWHVEDDFIAAVKSKGRIKPQPDFEVGLGYMRASTGSIFPCIALHGFFNGFGLIVAALVSVS